MTSYNLYDAAGFLVTNIQETGAWAIYQYNTNGWPEVVYSSYGNQTPTTSSNDCRVTRYYYEAEPEQNDVATNSPGRPRQEIEWLLGTPIRKTYYTYQTGTDIKKQVIVGGNYSDSTHLTSVRRYLTAGDFAHELASVDYPDGTRRVFGYATNGQQRTVTETYGEADPGNPDRVLAGVSNITVYGTVGEVESQTVYDHPGGLVIGFLTNRYDNLGRLTNTLYLDATAESTVYQDCCRKRVETDRDGVETVYELDELGRLLRIVRLGITNAMNYGLEPNRVLESRFGTDGSEVVLSDTRYDAAGRPVLQTSGQGGTTASVGWTYHFDGQGQLVQTNTFYTNETAGVTEIQNFARDGTLKKTGGSAVHGLRYADGFENGRYFTQTIRLDADGQDTGEWLKTFYDDFGRDTKRVLPDASYATNVYNAKGQLEKARDPDGVWTVHLYDNKGEWTGRGLDWDGNGELNSSTDSRVRLVTDYTTKQDNGTWTVQRTLTYAWDDAGNEVCVATNEIEVSGQRRWDTGPDGITKMELIRGGAGIKTLRRLAPDGDDLESYYVNGRLAEVRQLDNNWTKGFEYDPHGRLLQSTNHQGAAAAEFAYDPLERLTNWTARAGATAQSTTNILDTLGRLRQAKLPDGGAVDRDWFATGELKGVYGHHRYPAEYGYDLAGRLQTLTTWTNAGAQSGEAATGWSYNSLGNLTAKAYADSSGIGYQFSSGNRLLSRTLARSITVTYATNAAGLVTNIAYSDATPGVGLQYNRLGLVTNAVVAGQNTNALTYDVHGRLLTARQHGVTVTRSYNGVGQLDAIALNTTPAVSVQYQYDAFGRLTNAAFGGHQAGYSYLANALWIGQVEFRTNGSMKLKITSGVDGLGRLLGITNVNGQLAEVSRCAYGYDLANRRTAATNANSSRWEFKYDGLGQLTNAVKYWLSGALVAGQLFAYQYDDIGNRRWDQQGAGAVVHAVTLDGQGLNQAAQRTVPGAVSVLGTAAEGAAVRVNDLVASRAGDYYAATVSANNGQSPVWLAVTNRAVLPDSTNEWYSAVTGHVFVARTPEDFHYDADGNLTSDGRWTNTWDGENRLIEQETLPSAVAAGAPHEKLVFQYDWLGRRVSKTVSNYVAGNWELSIAHRFVYDGWNLVAILDAPSSTLLASFTWGSDLSGTHQGVAGIGGLLAMTVHTGTNAGTYYYGYDGNGNVAVLLSAQTSELSAQYEYGPFGELLRATGPLAFVNPFRFSTRYHDDETGLICYPRRYYDPSTGRWLSRDPIGELGGLNLYAFAGNDPVNRIDPLGLESPWWSGFKEGWNDAAAQTWETIHDAFAGMGQMGGTLTTEAGRGQMVAQYQQLVDLLLMMQYDECLKYRVLEQLGHQWRSWLDDLTTPDGISKLLQQFGTGMFISAGGAAAGGPLAKLLEIAKKLIPERVFGIGGKGGTLRIAPYGDLSGDVAGQAHHLNQTAAFRDVIPRNQGLSIELQGNIFTDAGAPHTSAHQSLESFWNTFRGSEIVPSNLQYTRALQQSLRAAGLPESQVQQAVRAAIRERVDFGLLGGMEVPRVPGPIRNLAQ